MAVKLERQFEIGVTKRGLYSVWIGIFDSGFNVAIAARMIQLRAKLRSTLLNLI
jgi:hypothetical protein